METFGSGKRSINVSEITWHASSSLFNVIKISEEEFTFCLKSLRACIIAIGDTPVFKGLVKELEGIEAKDGETRALQEMFNHMSTHQDEWLSTFPMIFHTKKDLEGLLLALRKKDPSNFIDTLVEEMGLLSKETGSIGKGKPRLRYLQTKMDGVINEWLSKLKNTEEEEVPCHSGCAMCCHLSVDCTDEEALMCLAYAVEMGVPIDVELLEGQQGKVVDEYWQMPLEKNKCIYLLDNGLCGVYPVRPLACRLLYARGDHQQCSCRDNVRKIQRLICLEGEVLNAAYKTLRDLEIEENLTYEIKHPTEIHTATFILLNHLKKR